MSKANELLSMMEGEDKGFAAEMKKRSELERAVKITDFSKEPAMKKSKILMLQDQGKLTYKELMAELSYMSNIDAEELNREEKQYLQLLDAEAKRIRKIVDQQIEDWKKS